MSTPARPVIYYDVALMVASVIWGVAFVFQRTAMAHAGPMTFNGIRFLLGALALAPVSIVVRRRWSREPPAGDRRTLVVGGVACGAALCVASAMQQVGLQYTTAGKAGFITGLYVVIVPVLRLVRRDVAPAGTWLGGALAVAGLYLLSVEEGFSVNPGDLWILGCGFFWAAQILLVARFSPRLRPLDLAPLSFAVCGVLSLGLGVLVEPFDAAGMGLVIVEILFMGLMSTGVAFTLQIVGQRRSPPAHASIIMSLEAVFAGLAGWLALGEELGGRALAGCALMLGGMVSSQLAEARRGTRRTSPPSEACAPTPGPCSHARACP